MYRNRIATLERGYDSLGRVMAASPELLDALYKALPFVEDALEDTVYKRKAVSEVLKKIHAVIKHAEGK
jgi:hypothetical protein